jgi:hypothetical protein
VGWYVFCWCWLKFAIGEILWFSKRKIVGPRILEGRDQQAVRWRDYMAKCLETIEDSEGSWECKRWREDELIHDGMQVACRYGFVWNRSGTQLCAGSQR